MTGTKPEAGGPALIDRDFIRGLAAGLNMTTMNGITADAAGTKAAAFQLPENIVFFQVDTVAGANDACLLPAAKKGKFCAVANFGANTLDLYGRGTDTINEAATANAYSMATEISAFFFCAEDGKWAAIKSA